MSRACSWRMRKSSALPAFSCLMICIWVPTVLAPLERPTSPHVHERDDEEGDEDHGLHQREGAERTELDGDGVEEDHFDVEQDEQHRDQVEADPEAEALLDLGGHAALVRVRLMGGGALRLRTQEAAGADEQRADEASESEEDDGWKVRPEHSASRCITNL